jgi:hypothetical protein
MSVAQLDTEAYYTLGTELSRMWINADEKLPPAMMPVLALVEVSGIGWVVWNAYLQQVDVSPVWRFPRVRPSSAPATVHYWMPEPWRPGSTK